MDSSKSWSCKTSREVKLVKFKVKKTTYYLNSLYRNIGCGDQYLILLAHTIKKIPEIDEFYLGNNNLTSKSAIVFFPNVSRLTSVISLENNRIGLGGTQMLKSLIENPETKLQYLNVEGNFLGNHSIYELLGAMSTDNCQLQILNINKNCINDTLIMSEVIERFFEHNSTLREFYIGWNLITAIGGNKIFNLLADNDSIVVLDLSYNSIGKCRSTLKRDTITMTQMFGAFFKQNERILHLDISNNSFTLEQSLEISTLLNLNKTIVGFHFEGNYGYVDSRQFLIINTEIKIQDRNKSDQLMPHKINGLQQVTTYSKKISQGVKDLCWICDGFQQQTLIWKLGQSGRAKGGPAFIHWGFEDYQGRYLGKINKKQKCFQIDEMIPSGIDIPFFWTFRWQQHIAKEFNFKKLLENEQQKTIQFPHKQMDIKLRKLNLVFRDTKHNFNQYYQKMFTVEPRELLEFKEKIVIVKTEWTFPISLMASWKPLRNSQLMECFEVDWANTRMPKIVKNEEDLEEVKSYLKSIYKWYLYGYRYYSSLNPIQDIWCIQQLCFLDIINDCQIIDENIGMADVEIKFVAAISDPSFKGNSRNPDRGLVRHQFMEVLVRLAEEKYVKSKVCSTYVEAVKRIIEEHCLDKFKRSFHFINTWREKYYWIEECDIVLKYYKDILLIPLYDTYSGKKTKPGKKKFTCLDEFNQLAQKGQLFGDNCGERQMYMAFNLSMMVQIDELNSDRMFQMSFVEFLEALARMAEAVSLKSPSPIAVNYEQDRTKQPLYLKLEGLCFQLFRILGDPEIKETTVIKPLFVQEVAQDESSDEEKQVYSVESFEDFDEEDNELGF